MALIFLKGIGPRTIWRLLNAVDSLERLFYCDPRDLVRITGLSEHVLKNLKYAKVEKRVEQELDFMMKNNIQMISLLDEEYPGVLKEIQDPPTALFVKGKLAGLKLKQLGVVGTRYATSRGISFCRELIHGLSQYDLSIVSGLAYGIDVSAHKAALEVKLPTFGVMAHGHDKLYPSAHAKLAEEMLSEGGLITEFPSGTKIERENFPIRNRIVAGLCDGLVVVESGIKGGSMITANLANDYNREVFAVPGGPKVKSSEGCNNLIKMHKAHLTTCVADITEMLRFTKTAEKPMTLFDINNETFDEWELKTIELFRQNHKRHFDDVLQCTGFKPHQVSEILLGLEFKDVIQSLPGNFYIMTA
ncbi:MAG: DNA-processing protein DprA [Flavobacteriales bacterium]|nr:DNA-processing protein DprA [Flavobacteriales bacterium]